MVKNAKCTYGTVLLGVVALEVLLPVLLLLATITVRQVQLGKLSDSKVQFEQLRVNASAVEAEPKTGGEITYQGVLYDIKDIKKDERGYILTVLADTTETELQTLNAGLAKNNNGCSTELKILPFFFLYFESQAGWQPTVTRHYAADFNEYYHSPLPWRTMSIISPPPRRALTLC